MSINPSRWLCRAAAVAVLTAGAARAQSQHLLPGYVVLATAPTDTLRGEVDLRRINRPEAQVLFRAGVTSGPRSYGLSEVLAAGQANGAQFRRCIVPREGTNAPALLEVLVSGPASLYADRTGRLPATYYLDKPGVAPMPLKNPQFVQVLRTAFADCPTVDTQVALGGRYVYAADDLRRYVVNYNRCMYPKAPVQASASKPQPLRLHWAAQVGVAQVQFFYPYVLRRQAVAGPLGPTGGAFAWLEFNRYLGLTAGLTLSSLRSDNTVSQLIPNDYLQTMRYRTKGSLLRLPVAVRGTLRPAGAAWRPYVQLGGHISRIMSGGLHWNNSYSGPGAPQAPQEFDIYYGGIGGGVQAEAGLLLRCPGGYLGAGLRYEQTRGFPNTGRSFLIDFNQIGLALTYTH